MRGKTIVGSSAGVYMLCQQYVGNTSQKLSDGLGILNIKAYCHFNAASENDLKVIERLKTSGEPGTEILTLRDYQTIVMYK